MAPGTPGQRALERPVEADPLYAFADEEPGPGVLWLES